MPFALSIIGILLIVVGFQNTYKEFGKQLASDFTGDNNFIYWIASLGVIGALGYIESLKKFSRIFMALIIIVMVLVNRGLFDKLMQAIREGTSEAPEYIGAPLPEKGGGGGGGISAGDAISAAVSLGGF